MILSCGNMKPENGQMIYLKVLISRKKNIFEKKKIRTLIMHSGGIPYTMHGD